MKFASNQIKSKLGKKVLLNEKLANYSWFNLGGPSEIFFKQIVFVEFVIIYFKLMEQT